jgi:hypothetical protein
MRLTRSCIACALLGLAALAVAPSPGRGQIVIGRDQPDFPITPAVRAEVIEGVLKELNKSYVYPEVAKKMEAAVRRRLANKEYDDVRTGAALSRALTDHLREVCKDKHLKVVHVGRKLPPPKGKPSPEELAKMREKMRRRGGSGIKALEVLEGNVGYLRLDAFAPPELAGDKAAAAMNFLADTRALIIDLRHNRGGTPAMVALLSTYLFDRRVHLNDLYFRPEDRTEQWWTLPYVPGKRYSGKDVYVLTSKTTFSAGEEFAYNLKALKRATLVGEVTGGGAHPVGPRRVHDQFLVMVPLARAINPITKTNWEGTGVKPDVEAAAAGALKRAHVLALKKLLEKAGTEDDKAELRRALGSVEGMDGKKDR